MTKADLIAGGLIIAFVLWLVLGIVLYSSEPWPAWLGGPQPFVTMCECFAISPEQKPACERELVKCHASQTAMSAPNVWWPWGH